MNLSRRNVIQRLKASRIDQPLEDDFAENLAARLKSLAVSGSQLEEARRGYIGRKAVAVAGSIGIFTWIGVTGVAASVGLVATGNMPAPIQNMVSSVLEVAGIQVPRANEGPASDETDQLVEGELDQELEITTTTLAEENTIESEGVVTPIPAETTVPDDEDEGVEQTPTTVAKPVGNKPTTTPSKGQENSSSGNENSGNSGNSGNSNNGNSGNAGNSGNSSNSNSGNSGNAGNSGNSGNSNNGNSGNAGNSGNSSNSNSGNSGNAGNSSNENSGNSGNSGESSNTNNGNSGQGNNGQGNGNGGSNAETVVTAPAVLAPLMPVAEPAKGNSGNQGNSSNQGKKK